MKSYVVALRPFALTLGTCFALSALAGTNALAAVKEDFQTHLPILNVNTLGKTPSKTAEIPVEVSILDSAQNGSQDLRQLAPQLKGKLEIRGHSSTKFAKKQYDLEISKKTASLLGLPAHKHWVLGAPYMDRNLIRNAFTFAVAGSLPDGQGGNWYAPRTRTFELFLNGHYRGVYTLTEKISGSPERANLGEFDFENPERSPFMLKAEWRKTQLDHEHFKSAEEYNYSYYEPKAKALKKLAEEDPARGKQFYTHIQNVVKQFESAVHAIEAGNYASYRQVVDTTSFQNFIFIQELTKNLDGYRRSIYLQYKDGKIFAGPVWDFDIALANLKAFKLHKPEGFLVGHGSYPFMKKEMFWFKQMLRDPAFARELIQRYRDLRKPGGPLSTQAVLAHFDQLSAEVSGPAQDRNFRVWNPNPGDNDGLISPDGVLTLVIPRYKPFRYPQVSGEIREWILERLDWLDRNIQNVANDLPPSYADAL